MTQTSINRLSEELFMVFDVESIGLHGEGWHVGWVVINRAGQQLDEGSATCDYMAAEGPLASRKWVLENCRVEPTTHGYPFEVREAFWQAWMKWRDRGAKLAADVAWPVEARFLSQCVAAAMPVREWGGPYPLIDIASVRFAVGLDPLATVERKPDELPQHDALADARQSARLLLESLSIIDRLTLSGGGEQPQHLVQSDPHSAMGDVGSVEQSTTPDNLRFPVTSEYRQPRHQYPFAIRIDGDKVFNWGPGDRWNFTCILRPGAFDRWPIIPRERAMELCGCTAPSTH